MRGTRPKLSLDFTSSDLVSGLKSPSVLLLSPLKIRVRDEFNPRGRHTNQEEAFSEDRLLDLGESLRRDGVLSPLLVSQDAEGEYWLIAGERRLRAARLVNLNEVPVILKDEQNSYRIALIENLQRENLNAVDETFGVLQLLAQETGLDQDELPAALRQAARKDAEDPHELGKKLRSYGNHSLDAWARHRLNFLRLSSLELDAIRSRLAPWRNIIELVRLPEGNDRKLLLDKITQDALSLKQISAEVNSILGKKTVSPEFKQLFKGINPERVAALPDDKRAEARALLQKLQEILS
ncbi:ParB/RepB/Spo0J family partition protein [Deinococcus sp. Leaf326]|uniref:ParB/RepB/Spo0J family partition protein n=1 Tax=Deinococcus sp. Leaf326 TaxID=1736338 RepID=UPI000A8214BD|nr:ParB/RepB/Spo0J family partition protein [Deinococcus sp. Leaf326]